MKAKIFHHYYKRAWLSFANLVSLIMPPTRCFKIRSKLFRIAGLKIERDVCIVGGSWFHYSNILIGQNTWISSDCHFYCSETANINIGNNVDIGPGCFISTGTHEIGNPEERAGKNIAKAIYIGNGTWIGMRSTIIAGSVVGNSSIVAAGSVVAGEFPGNVLIGGVPAKIIKEI